MYITRFRIDYDNDQGELSPPALFVINDYRIESARPLTKEELLEYLRNKNTRAFELMNEMSWLLSMPQDVYKPDWKGSSLKFFPVASRCFVWVFHQATFEAHMRKNQIVYPKQAMSADLKK